MMIDDAMLRRASSPPTRPITFAAAHFSRHVTLSPMAARGGSSARENSCRQLAIYLRDYRRFTEPTAI